MATNEASHEVGEFTVNIPDEKLEDTYEQLRRTLFSKDFANDDWRYGYHRKLVDYWIHEHDRRAIERSMNELAPHYKDDPHGRPAALHPRERRGPQPHACSSTTAGPGLSGTCAR